MASPLSLHPTVWTPADARCALSLVLDAALVPSNEAGGLRAECVRSNVARFVVFLTTLTVPRSVAHVVVLDNFLSASDCDSILSRLAPDASLPSPDASRWERRTADRADAAPLLAQCTWGLRSEVMRSLEASPPHGLRELHTRLALLFPDATVCHQPAFDGDASDFACERYVANAAVHGDAFAWHVDADPSCFPDSEWTRRHGQYVNRERGSPLFASALLYLNPFWPEEFDAETLFLDKPTGAGFFVRPAQGRLVLMDGDVTHRLSPPSLTANRPRFSLVLKLVLLPRDAAGGRLCVARREWGRPVAFGSAAKMEAVTRSLMGGGDGQAAAEARARPAGADEDDARKRSRTR